LALASLALTLIPVAFSQPENIKIVSYTYYTDMGGFVDLIGEVQNVGTTTVDPIYLTGTFKSASGATIDTSYCKVWVADLLPQQKAPFYIEFLPQSWSQADIASVIITPTVANVTNNYQYQDLTITNKKESIGTTGNYSGAYSVDGTIENTGNQAATNLTVVGTFYNSTGNVVGVGYTNYLTPAVLNPSESLSFTVYAFDVNQSMVPASMKIASYALLVQTQGPILQGNAPVPTSNQGGSPIVTSNPSSGSSSQGGTGSSSNSSFNPTIIYVVIIVVVVAIVGGVLALKRSKPRQTVKEARRARKNRMG
jgi:hypothetical protein